MVFGGLFSSEWEPERWISWSLRPCEFWHSAQSSNSRSDVDSIFWRKHVRLDGNTPKSSSRSPASWVSAVIPTSQSQAEEVIMLDAFPRNYKWETRFWHDGPSKRFKCQLSWSFPCLCGPFSVLVYTSAKGVDLYFFLQVNFKAWSVFRKCFKTPGEMKMLSPLWISVPVIRCCSFRWRGALFRVKFRRVLPRPAVLSTNVNDRLTAYCQTGNVL